MASSSALRHIGPALSRLQASTIAPERLIEPKVGRNPVTPQLCEGDTIEPQVSVPMANGSRPAETAEAGPADEPLDPTVRFQGFFVLPPNQLSPLANAPSVSLAHNTAPAYAGRIGQRKPGPYCAPSLRWAHWPAATTGLAAKQKIPGISLSGQAVHPPAPPPLFPPACCHLPSAQKPGALLYRLRTVAG